MKAVLLYRPHSGHGSTVEQYAKDFKKRTSYEINLMDYDSVQGVEFATNRDITSIPAVVVVDDYGVVQKQWLGEALPLFNEVAGHLWDHA